MPIAQVLINELALRISGFVQADVYDAAGVLPPGSFDLVYTGVGALTWLPDIRRWGRVVADLLRPGGRLFIRDGHPMLFTTEDPRDDGLLVVRYPYFEMAEPLGAVEQDGDAATATGAGPAAPYTSDTNRPRTAAPRAPAIQAIRCPLLDC